MKTPQLDLFTDNLISKSVSRQKSLSMDADASVQWKTKIAAHQQRAKENQPEQGALFDLTQAHVDLDKIDPFNLRPFPMSFYRLPVDNPGEACIYFVVDSAAFHKGGRIEQLIEQAGCRLLYLPPYSPDLNKIEKCWSWLKSRIRHCKSEFNCLRDAMKHILKLAS